MFLAKLLRFLLFAILLRWVFVLLRGAFGGGGSRRSHENTTTPKDAELVFDAVCNTYVPKDRALRAVVGGHERHFCSSECRSRALALDAAS